MIVARALRGGDSCIERGAGIVDAAGFGEELAVLKVAGDVVGVRGEERFEVLVGRGGVTGVRTLHGQAVTGKGVAGLGGNEFLEHLATGLPLRFGHGRR
jgi:hypothetical protein